MNSHPIKVLVLGTGNMGSSHARAYKNLAGFQLVGLIARSPDRRKPLAKELGDIPQFDNLDDAIESSQANAIAICTYPDSHHEFAVKCLNVGLHVFIEKPIAETTEQAMEVAALAEQKGKKVVVGYILRHHPAWIQFIEAAQTLGKPLVMRMNLNQQSKSDEWITHKNLMQSMSPIVDCGVHYVDIMCQMTRSKPIRVQAIGARLTDEIDTEMYNYGQLQVIFEDRSVGWYEAGWGPMISETAYFVKDVIGPKGCVSIVEPSENSSDIDSHTKVSALKKHFAALNYKGEFEQKDILIDISDEPDHQELCNREQDFFLKAIREDLDLTDHLNDAINSLRIVLAADESIRTGQVVKLK